MAGGGRVLSAEQIATALGGYRNGMSGYLCRCPAHRDRTPSLALRDEDGKVLVHCHAGCPQAAVIDALRARQLWPVGYANGSPAVLPPPRRERDDVEARIRRALIWWRDGVDPRGTRAERYFERSKIALDDSLAMRVLRYHPRCMFGLDELRNPVFKPCVLALFRDIATNAPQAIHRLALSDADDVGDGKKMLGPVGGCAVKLDEAEGYGLSIAEGIGTALAVRTLGIRPIWALGSAQAIKSFPVLSGIASLTIYADNDKNGVGQDAALACQARWRAAQREVEIRMPRGVGCDWQDELAVAL